MCLGQILWGNFDQDDYALEENRPAKYQHDTEKQEKRFHYLKIENFSYLSWLSIRCRYMAPF